MRKHIKLKSNDNTSETIIIFHLGFSSVRIRRVRVSEASRARGERRDHVIAGDIVRRGGALRFIVVH